MTPERIAKFRIHGKFVEVNVTTFAQEVDMALHCGCKNYGADNGLTHLWIEEACRTGVATGEKKTIVDAQLLEGYNKSRSIINELALSLEATVDGTAVIRFIMSRSSRWLPHDPSGMLDMAFLRSYTGETGAEEMWRILKSKLPAPNVVNDIDIILESLHEFHESRLASFCGKQPKSEVKAVIDAVKTAKDSDRVSPEKLNVADPRKKRRSLRPCPICSVTKFRIRRAALRR